MSLGYELLHCKDCITEQKAFIIVFGIVGVTVFEFSLRAMVLCVYYLIHFLRVYGVITLTISIAPSARVKEFIQGHMANT